MGFFYSLRARILGGILTLLLLFGLALMVYVKTDISDRLSRQLQKRGVSIAHQVAGQSAGAILAEDVFDMRIRVAELLALETDIVYLVFFSTDGRVLAHSFGDTFPRELLEANTLAAGEDHSIRLLNTGQGLIYDIAVPVVRGGVGQVRLGLSGEEIKSSVDDVTGDIVFVTLGLMAVGFLLAIPLSSAVTVPARRLIKAVEDVASGSLDSHVSVAGRDEMATLTASFNRMTQKLRQARRDLEGSNAELAQEVARRSSVEARLASQVRFLEVLMDDIPSPVFFQDGHGVLMGCNKAFATFFGLTQEEMIGQPVSHFLDRDQAREHRLLDEKALTENAGWSHEETFRHHDGTLRTVILHKAAFPGEAGGSSGLVGAMADVTREREVAQMKSEFISTVAHEFQTPLTMIIGFSEVLTENEGLTAEERADFQMIVHQKALFLSRMVDELLDISRIEEGRGLPMHLDDCPVDRWLEGGVDSFKRGYPDYLFELTVSEKGLSLYADCERLDHVLENLLSNAVKYSPPGSRITLSGRRIRERFLLTVTDQGKGMTPDQLSRVFEKFYRADATETAPRGTGLGMYIVKSIIQAHRGTVHVESAPGEGTTVTVVLPCQGVPEPLASR